MKLAINLASRRHLNQRAISLVLSCTIVLLICLLALQGNTYFQDHQLATTYQSHLNELQDQLRGKLPERLSPKEIAEQRQSYDQAGALLKRDAFRWTSLFDQMEGLLPAGVSLRSLNPDYGKSSLLLNGIAKDLKSLQALLDSLGKEQFDQVYLNNQGEVAVDDGRGGKRNALSFSISLGGVF